MLPAALWLWAPLVFLAVDLGFEFTAPRPMVENFVAEDGFVEILQFVVAFAAFLAGINTWRGLDWKRQRGLAVWVGLAILGSFYIAGEEISWGQQFFHWATPGSWDVINDQHETNLHNTSSWLDQKPRIILEIGVIAGGLLLPWLVKKWPQRIPSWLRTITPPVCIGVISGVYLFVKLAGTFGDETGFKLFLRPSEICEFYIYYFVLVYLLWIRQAYTGLPKE